MLNNWEKLWLLMWKNWKTQSKHKVELLCRILFPVIFFIILLIMRNLASEQKYAYPIIYREFPPLFTVYRQKGAAIIKPEIPYYPKSSCVEDVVKYAEGWLSRNYGGGDLSNISLVAYDNIYQIENEVQINNKIAAIQFDESFKNEIECPKELRYKIRFPSELRRLSFNPFIPGNIANWETNSNFLEYDYNLPLSGSKFQPDIYPSYMLEGFIGIQHAIALGFIHKYKTSRDFETNLFRIRKFPFPPFVVADFSKELEKYLAFFTIISFLYPSCQIVKDITSEKQKQLKEVMDTMGLSNWLHWIAWFCKFFAIKFITIVLIIFTLKITIDEVKILDHSNWSILFFCFIVYSISLITFCFMIATFFTKVSLAVIVSFFLWFITYLPFVLTRNDYLFMSLSQKLGLSLFSNTAMAYILQLITKFESRNQGLQWQNLFSPVNNDDNLSVGLVLMMLLLDSMLYMLIVLYAEKMSREGYVAAKKWYYRFTKGFWFPNSIKPDVISEDVNVKRTSNASAFEVEKDKKVGISIKNLRKTFKERVAIKNLTLDMYEDDITVLLGQNGAGKTTIISILTGMISPTSGTASLYGYDIRTNLINARMSLGICPQQNILFDQLTVREHIIFFSRLRGMEYEEVKAEVQKYVELLELEHKIDSVPKELSEGMKRKLSVAAAFCGGSKVVLCDEPTSGMDPPGRRALWNLLEGEKNGRTILLTTHLMDEADILGDRIAIMWNGVLKACGSSFYLKKKYGTGYHLTCEKQSDCDTSQVTELLKEYVSDVVVENDIGFELTYQLPDEDIASFEEMLGQLEKNMESLKIDSYGISNTTLGEVFMLVGSNVKKHNTSVDARNIQNYNNDTGFKLTLKHWEAMLTKNFLHFIRNYKTFLFLNFLAILFVISAVSVIKAYDPLSQLKPLHFGLARYKTTVTVVQFNELFKDGLENEIVREYKRYVQNFGEHHKYIQINDDFQKYVIDVSKKHVAEFNTKYFIGATVNSNKIIMWFNGKMYHSLPLSLNAMHNAVLRATTSDPEFRFYVTNHPFEYHEKTKLQNKAGFKTAEIISLSLALLMSFVTSYYIIIPIKERNSRCKLLQFVSGVRGITFWFSQFIFDFATYLITATIIIIALACLQYESFSTGSELGRIYLIFLFYGLGSLPLTYLLSFCFKEPATGYAILSTIKMFTGLLVFLYNIFKTNSWKESVWGALFPSNFLFRSLTTITSIATDQLYCMRICTENVADKDFICAMEELCKKDNRCCKILDYFEWNGLKSGITFVFTGFILSFIFLLMMEYRYFDNVFSFVERTLNQKYYKNSFEHLDEANEDDDVKAEKRRISQMSREDIKKTNLVLNQVTKYYLKFLAVKKISVAVNSFECFGLLGLNGAGKTSTFKMLTGDESITYGEAYVKGLSIRKEMNAVFCEIGYCPQFDALQEEFTGREILKMFALLRGISKQSVDLVTKHYAKTFNFEKDIDKRISSYSGGNKRKLSAAISFIGNPTVIYLDEPTTGMDPSAKRDLWNTVCQIRDFGKSIVLTSHNMEECEALCTRLTIMINGELKCLGSTQHLKNKFSKGIVLKIKIGKNDKRNNSNKNLSKFKIEEETLINDEKFYDNETIDKVIRFVENEFDQAQLKDIRQGLLTFYIPLQNVRWSKMFGIMEANKENLQITDYSISQTSLQEIFLDIAFNPPN